MKYLFVFVFLVIPAIITGVNGKFDFTSILLLTVGLLAFLEKRRDIVDKFF